MCVKVFPPEWSTICTDRWFFFFKLKAISLNIVLFPNKQAVSQSKSNKADLKTKFIAPKNRARLFSKDNCLRIFIFKTFSHFEMEKGGRAFFPNIVNGSLSSAMNETFNLMLIQMTFSI